MGIKNLIKLIEKEASDSIRYKPITDYHNKTLGIDANLMIYRMILGIRKSGYDLKNNGRTVTHIHAIFQKLVYFKINGIRAVFVFDGMSPKIKERTITDRKKVKQIQQAKYENAKSLDEKKRLYYQKSDITDDERIDVMNCIRIFGFPIIESEDEADMTLAQLSIDKVIDAIVTDDLDILVFGGTPILKNFSISDKKKIQEIDLKQMLRGLKINQQQLTDIAILIGCDYCQKAPNIGPMKALDIVRQRISVTRFINMLDYKAAYNLFSSSRPSINKYKYKESSINKDRLLILLNDMEFKQKYIDTLFKKIALFLQS
jgi:flap endonuclease-1